MKKQKQNKNLLNPNPIQRQTWVAVRAKNPTSCKSSTLGNYWAMMSPKNLKQSFLQFPSFFLHSLEDAIKRLSQFAMQPITFCPGGGGGTSLKEANGDVPLDGVAFSRLD